jgi:hypothetical protein
MAMTMRYGSDAEPNLFHDQVGCTKGNAIPEDERVRDVSGRTRCPGCAQLMRDEQGERR